MVITTSASRTASTPVRATSTPLPAAASWAAAGLSAAKTLVPATTSKARQRLRDAVAPAAPTVIDVDGMPFPDQVLFAQVALSTMGLVRGFGVKSRDVVYE